MGAEGEGLRRWKGNSRVLRLIGEEPLPVIVVQRDALIREIPDYQALFSGIVVIPGIGAHPRACFSRVAVSHSGRESLVSEGSIVAVVIQLVRLRVVCDQEIKPAVVVVVRQRNSKRLVGRIAEPGFTGHIFEAAVADIVKQSDTFALVQLRSAVRFVNLIEGAEFVRLH